MIDTTIMKYLYKILQRKSEFLFLLEGIGDERTTFDEQKKEKTEDEKTEDETMENLAESVILFSKEQDAENFPEDVTAAEVLEKIKRWGYQESWRRVAHIMKRDNWRYEDIREILEKSAKLIQEERAKELIEEIREAVERIK